MKRRKIGIDFDDVLMDFNDALFAYHNPIYGTNFTKEDVKSFDLELTWGCTREEAIKRCFEFYNAHSHYNANTVEGATQAIKRLSNDHDLIVVTSRPDSIKDQTINWLEKNFPKTFSQVIFTNHYHGDVSKRISKADVCKVEGIQIFIDDNMDNALALAKEGINTFLFDAPWNQGEIPENMTRVYSWEELVSRIL